METFRLGLEHRKYPRVPFKKGVKCRLFAEDVQNGELAQDLSEGGIRIRSNVFIPMGEAISLGIQLSETEEVVEIVGRVVWVRFVPYSEVYQVGVEFVKDAAFSRWRIGRFAGSAS